MKYGTLLKILYFFLPAAAAVRTVQLICTVNPADGFVYRKYESLSLTLGIITAAVCAAFIISGLSLKTAGKPAPEKYGNSVMISLFVMSFFSIAGGIVALFFSAPVTTQVTISAAADILMGIFFFAGAKGCLEKRTINGATGIAAVFWSAAKLVIYYSNFDGIIMNTENILNLMALCTSMMFWLYFAHINVSYRTVSSLKYVWAFGSMAAFFCTLCTVPRITVTIIGRNDVLNTASSIEPVNIATIIFILAIFSSLKSQMKATRLDRLVSVAQKEDKDEDQDENNNLNDFDFSENGDIQ